MYTVCPWSTNVLVWVKVGSGAPSRNAMLNCQKKLTPTIHTAMKYNEKVTRIVLFHIGSRVCSTNCAEDGVRSPQ